MRIEGTTVPIFAVIFAICGLACSCDGDKNKTTAGAVVPRKNIEGITISNMQNGDEMFASSDAAAVNDQSVLHLVGTAKVYGKPPSSEFLAICKCKEGKYHVISYGVTTFKLTSFGRHENYKTAASLLMRPKPPEVEDLAMLFDSTKPIGTGKKEKEVHDPIVP